MLVVVLGIDGAGKSTAARSLVDRVRLNGGRAMLLQNYSGRRSISAWCAAHDVRLHPRLADTVETLIRIGHVLVSHLRARHFDGVVVMDRHLHCQLALRNVRGLPHGYVVPWLIRHLPQPDLMVFFDISAEQAHQRITRRGIDDESPSYLQAFRAAYRALPEYPGFTSIAADRPVAEITAELEGLLARPPAVSPVGRLTSSLARRFAQCLPSRAA